MNSITVSTFFIGWFYPFVQNLRKSDSFLSLTRINGSRVDWRLDGWRLPQALIQNIILYTIFGVHQNTYDSLGGFMMQSKTSQKKLLQNQER